MGSHTVEYTVKGKWNKGGEERMQKFSMQDTERFPRSVAQFKRKKGREQCQNKVRQRQCPCIFISIYLHKEKTRDREERMWLSHKWCISTILYHSYF